jgi:amino acid transporter
MSAEETLTQPRSMGSPVHPPRVMGFADLLLFYVVTGISLRWIATAASNGPSSILIWIGAWLCFYVPLALAVIELSSRYPQEGGLYNWSKQSFGEFAGYIAAWTYWACNLPYFPTVLYFAAGNALYLGGRRWMHLSNNASFYIWFSVLSLALVTGLNLVGLSVGKWLHNAGAFGMWVPVAIVIVMGFVARHRFGSATQFTVSSMVPPTHLKDMVFWSILIFAFAGCETASFMGDEVKNASRALPRALLLSGLVVAVCYILGTVCVLLALPATEASNLQGLMQAIARTADRLGWVGVIPISAMLIVLSNLGAAGAYVAAAARLPFVAGIDHLLPSAFAKLHPRWGTPHLGLLIQFVCGVLFAFLGQAGTSVKGAYDVLVSMTVVTYFVPYLFVFAALFRVQREKAGPQVIRVPGGKPVAIFVSCVGFVVTALTILISLLPPPEELNQVLATGKIVVLTTILLAIGALFYYLARRKRDALLRIAVKQGSSAI